MSSSLDDVTLLELLPSSIAGDETIQAACETVQPELDAVTGVIPTFEIYRRLQANDLPIDVLRLLAWEHRVYGVEWRLALTLEAKHELVKNAFELNRRRGTRWAVERVFDLIGLHAELREWWEPGESGTPGTFRISILDVTGRGIEEEEIALLDELVSTYKPLSRHNTGINLVETTEGDVYAHGSISVVSAYELGRPEPVPLTIGGDPMTINGDIVTI